MQYIDDAVRCFAELDALPKLQANLSQRFKLTGEIYEYLVMAAERYQRTLFGQYLVLYGHQLKPGDTIVVDEDRNARVARLGFVYSTERERKPVDEFSAAATGVKIVFPTQRRVGNITENSIRGTIAPLNARFKVVRW